MSFLCVSCKATLDLSIIKISNLDSFLPNSITCLWQLLRNAARVKTMGGWLKDQREKKRAEARTRKAQAYAATSVAGVAAAVAAVVAGTVFSSTEGAKVTCGDNKITAAIASAASLVASHCVEMAQTMGASHDQIIKAIRSAVGAQTSGDVMALTAGAATGTNLTN